MGGTVIAAWQAQRRGWHAARAGAPRISNPLRTSTHKPAQMVHDAWFIGWDEGAAPVVTVDQAMIEAAMERRKYTLLELADNGRLVRSIFDDVDL